MVLSPHVALSVAAALAYQKFSQGPRDFYDVEHYSAVLNAVAQALAGVMRIYVADNEDTPRALTDAALEGAVVRRGATVLQLADGRAFRRVLVRRDELHAAVDRLRRSGWTLGAAALRKEKR
jgi:hypothetical protein